MGGVVVSMLGVVASHIKCTRTQNNEQTSCKADKDDISQVNCEFEVQ